jgi:hypothetical protein
MSTSNQSKSARKNLIKAAFAGMLAVGIASGVHAQINQSPASDVASTVQAHADKASCKGMAGCKTAKDVHAKDKASCKGMAGCKTAKDVHAKDKASCKGMAGCKTAKDVHAKDKASCKGMAGCKTAKDASGN